MGELTSPQRADLRLMFEAQGVPRILPSATPASFTLTPDSPSMQVVLSAGDYGGRGWSFDLSVGAVGGVLLRAPVELSVRVKRRVELGFAPDSLTLVGGAPSSTALLAVSPRLRSGEAIEFFLGLDGYTFDPSDPQLDNGVSDVVISVGAEVGAISATLDLAEASTPLGFIDLADVDFVYGDLSLTALRGVRMVLEAQASTRLIPGSSLAIAVRTEPPLEAAERTTATLSFSRPLPPGLTLVPAPGEALRLDEANQAVLSAVAPDFTLILNVAADQPPGETLTLGVSGEGEGVGVLEGASLTLEIVKPQVSLSLVPETAGQVKLLAAPDGMATAVLSVVPETLGDALRHGREALVEVEIDTEADGQIPGGLEFVSTSSTRLTTTLTTANVSTNLVLRALTPAVSGTLRVSASPHGDVEFAPVELPVQVLQRVEVRFVDDSLPQIIAGAASTPVVVELAGASGAELTGYEEVEVSLSGSDALVPPDVAGEGVTFDPANFTLTAASTGREVRIGAGPRTRGPIRNNRRQLTTVSAEVEMLGTRPAASLSLRLVPEFRVGFSETAVTLVRGSATRGMRTILVGIRTLSIPVLFHRPPNRHFNDPILLDGGYLWNDGPPPSGVTARFFARVFIGDFRNTLVITADESAPLGDYVVALSNFSPAEIDYATIPGHEFGSSTSTETLRVTIVAAPIFSAVLEPAAPIEVEQGRGTTFLVTTDPVLEIGEAATVLLALSSPTLGASFGGRDRLEVLLSATMRSRELEISAPVSAAIGSTVAGSVSLEIDSLDPGASPAAKQPAFSVSVSSPRVTLSLASHDGGALGDRLVLSENASTALRVSLAAGELTSPQQADLALMLEAQGSPLQVSPQSFTLSPDNLSQQLTLSAGDFGGLGGSFVLRVVAVGEVALRAPVELPVLVKRRVELGFITDSLADSLTSSLTLVREGRSESVRLEVSPPLRRGEAIDFSLGLSGYTFDPSDPRLDEGVSDLVISVRAGVGAVSATLDLADAATLGGFTDLAGVDFVYGDLSLFQGVRVVLEAQASTRLIGGSSLAVTLRTEPALEAAERATVTLSLSPGLTPAPARGEALRLDGMNQLVLSAADSDFALILNVAPDRTPGETLTLGVSGESEDVVVLEGASLTLEVVKPRVSLSLVPATAGQVKLLAAPDGIATAVLSIVPETLKDALNHGREALVDVEVPGGLELVSASPTTLTMANLSRNVVLRALTPAVSGTLRVSASPDGDVEFAPVELAVQVLQRVEVRFVNGSPPRIVAGAAATPVVVELVGSPPGAELTGYERVEVSLSGSDAVAPGEAGQASEGVTFDSADSVGFTLTAASSRREVQIRAGPRTRGPVRDGQRQLTASSAEVEMLGTRPAASLSMRLVPEFRLGFSEATLRLILTIDSQRAKSVELRVSGPSLPFADERITGEVTVPPSINGGINVEREGEPFSSFTFDSSSLSTGLVIWVPEDATTGVFEVSVDNPQVGLDHAYVTLSGLDFDAAVSEASLSVEIVDAAQYVTVFEPSTPIAVEQGRSATFLVTTEPPLEAGESARVSLTLSSPTLGTSFSERDRLEVSLSAALRSSEVEISVPATAAIGSVISGEVSLDVVSPDPDAAGSPDQPAFSVSVSTPRVTLSLTSHDGGALGDRLVLSENASTALRVSLAAGELTSPQQADLVLVLEAQGSPGTSPIMSPGATPSSFTLSPANLSTQLTLSAGDFGGLGGSFVLRVVAVNEVELRAPVELPVRVKRRVELGFISDSLADSLADSLTSSLTLIHGGPSTSVRIHVSPPLRSGEAIDFSLGLSGYTFDPSDPRLDDGVSEVTISVGASTAPTSATLDLKSAATPSGFADLADVDFVYGGLSLTALRGVRMVLETQASTRLIGGSSLAVTLRTEPALAAAERTTATLSFSQGLILAPAPGELLTLAKVNQGVNQGANQLVLSAADSDFILSLGVAPDRSPGETLRLRVSGEGEDVGVLEGASLTLEVVKPRVSLSLVPETEGQVKLLAAPDETATAVLSIVPETLGDALRHGREALVEVEIDTEIPGGLELVSTSPTTLTMANVSTNVVLRAKTPAVSGTLRVSASPDGDVEFAPVELAVQVLQRVAVRFVDGSLPRIVAGAAATPVVVELVGSPPGAALTGYEVVEVTLSGSDAVAPDEAGQGVGQAVDEGVTFDSASSVSFTLTAASSRREVEIRAGPRTRGPVRSNQRQLTATSAEVEMLGTRPAASLSLRLVPEFGLGFSETALRLVLSNASQRAKPVEFRVSGPSLPFADERITGELTAPSVIDVEQGGEPFSSFTFDASNLSTGLVISLSEAATTGVFEVSVDNLQVGLDHAYVSLLDFDASASGVPLSVEVVDAARYLAVLEPSTQIEVEQGRSATFLVTIDPTLEAGESATVSLTLSSPTMGASFGGRDRLDVVLSATSQSREVEVSASASAPIDSTIAGEVSLDVDFLDPNASVSPDQPAFSVSVSTPQATVSLTSDDGGALGDELVLSQNASTALRVNLALGELTSPQQVDLELMLVDVQAPPGVSLLRSPRVSLQSVTLSPAVPSRQLTLHAGDFRGSGGSFVLRVVAVGEVALRAPLELPVRVKRRVELRFTTDSLTDSLTLVSGGRSSSAHLTVSPSLRSGEQIDFSLGLSGYTFVPSDPRLDESVSDVTISVAAVVGVEVGAASTTLDLAGAATTVSGFADLADVDFVYGSLSLTALRGVRMVLEAQASTRLIGGSSLAVTVRTEPALEAAERTTATLSFSSGLTLAPAPGEALRLARVDQGVNQGANQVVLSAADSDFTLILNVAADRSPGETLTLEVSGEGEGVGVLEGASLPLEVVKPQVSLSLVPETAGQVKLLAAPDGIATAVLSIVPETLGDALEHGREALVEVEIDTGEVSGGLELVSPSPTSLTRANVSRNVVLRALTPAVSGTLRVSASPDGDVEFAPVELAVQVLQRVVVRFVDGSTPRIVAGAAATPVVVELVGSPPGAELTGYERVEVTLSGSDAVAPSGAGQGINEGVTFDSASSISFTLTAASTYREVRIRAGPRTRGPVRGGERQLTATSAEVEMLGTQPAASLSLRLVPEFRLDFSETALRLILSRASQRAKSVELRISGPSLPFADERITGDLETTVTVTVEQSDEPFSSFTFDASSISTGLVISAPETATTGVVEVSVGNLDVVLDHEYVSLGSGLDFGASVSGASLSVEIVDAARYVAVFEPSPPIEVEQGRRTTFLVAIDPTLEAGESATLSLSLSPPTMGTSFGGRESLDILLSETLQSSEVEVSAPVSAAIGSVIAGAVSLDVDFLDPNASVSPDQPAFSVSVSSPRVALSLASHDGGVLGDELVLSENASTALRVSLAAGELTPPQQADLMLVFEALGRPDVSPSVSPQSVTLSPASPSMQLDLNAGDYGGRGGSFVLRVVAVGGVALRAPVELPVRVKRRVELQFTPDSLTLVGGGPSSTVLLAVSPPLRSGERIDFSLGLSGYTFDPSDPRLRSGVSDVTVTVGAEVGAASATLDLAGAATPGGFADLAGVDFVYGNLSLTALRGVRMVLEVQASTMLIAGSSLAVTLRTEPALAAAERTTATLSFSPSLSQGLTLAPVPGEALTLDEMNQVVLSADDSDFALILNVAADRSPGETLRLEVSAEGEGVGVLEGASLTLEVVKPRVSLSLVPETARQVKLAKLLVAPDRTATAVLSVVPETLGDALRHGREALVDVEIDAEIPGGLELVSPSPTSLTLANVSRNVVLRALTPGVSGTLRVSASPDSDVEFAPVELAVQVLQRVVVRFVDGSTPRIVAGAASTPVIVELVGSPPDAELTGYETVEVSLSGSDAVAPSGAGQAVDEGVTFDSASSVGFTLTAASSRREVQIRAGPRTRGPVRGGERQLTAVSAEVEMLGTRPASSLSLRLVPEFGLDFSETALRLILGNVSQRAKPVEFRVSGPSLPFADERITGGVTAPPSINVERGGEPFSSFTFDASSLSTGLVISVSDVATTGVFEVSVANPRVDLDHAYVTLSGLDFDASVSEASLSVEILDAARYLTVFEPSPPIEVEQGRSATFLVTIDPPLEPGESATVSLTLSSPTLVSFGGRESLEVLLSATSQSSEVEISAPVSAAIGSVIAGAVSLDVDFLDPGASVSPDQPTFSVSVSSPRVTVSLTSHDGGVLDDELVLSQNASTMVRVSLAAGELTSPQRADLALMVLAQGTPDVPPSVSPGSFTLSPPNNLSMQLDLSAGDFRGLGGSFVLRVVAVGGVALRAPVELPVRVKRRVELGFITDSLTASLTLVGGGRSSTVRIHVSPPLRSGERIDFSLGLSGYTFVPSDPRLDSDASSATVSVGAEAGAGPATLDLAGAATPGGFADLADVDFVYGSLSLTALRGVRMVLEAQDSVRLIGGSSLEVTLRTEPPLEAGERITASLSVSQGLTPTPAPGEALTLDEMNQLALSAADSDFALILNVAADQSPGERLTLGVSGEGEGVGVLEGASLTLEVVKPRVSLSLVPETAGQVKLLAAPDGTATAVLSIVPETLGDALRHGREARVEVEIDTEADGQIPGGLELVSTSSTRLTATLTSANVSRNLVLRALTPAVSGILRVSASPDGDVEFAPVELPVQVLQRVEVRFVDDSLPQIIAGAASTPVVVELAGASGAELTGYEEVEVSLSGSDALVPPDVAGEGVTFDPANFTLTAASTGREVRIGAGPRTRGPIRNNRRQLTTVSAEVEMLGTRPAASLSLRLVPEFRVGFSETAVTLVRGSATRGMRTILVGIRTLSIPVLFHRPPNRHFNDPILLDGGYLWNDGPPPSGVTARFFARVFIGDFRNTLVITADESAPLGDYVVALSNFSPAEIDYATIPGHEFGSSTSTETLRVTIVAAPIFSAVLEPAAPIEVEQGRGTTFLVTTDPVLEIGEAATVLLALSSPTLGASFGGRDRLEVLLSATMRSRELEISAPVSAAIGSTVAGSVSLEIDSLDPGASPAADQPAFSVSVSTPRVTLSLAFHDGGALGDRLVLSENASTALRVSLAAGELTSPQQADLVLMLEAQGSPLQVSPQSFTLSPDNLSQQLTLSAGDFGGLGGSFVLRVVAVGEVALRAPVELPVLVKRRVELGFTPSSLILVGGGPSSSVRLDVSPPLRRGEAIDFSLGLGGYTFVPSDPRLDDGVSDVVISVGAEVGAASATLDLEGAATPGGFADLAGVDFVYGDLSLLRGVRMVLEAQGSTRLIAGSSLAVTVRTESALQAAERTTATLSFPPGLTPAPAPGEALRLDGMNQVVLSADDSDFALIVNVAPDRSPGETLTLRVSGESEDVVVLEGASLTLEVVKPRVSLSLVPETAGQVKLLAAPDGTVTAVLSIVPETLGDALRHGREALVDVEIDAEIPGGLELVSPSPTTLTMADVSRNVVLRALTPAVSGTLRVSMLPHSDVEFAPVELAVQVLQRVAVRFVDGSTPRIVAGAASTPVVVELVGSPPGAELTGYEEVEVSLSGSDAVAPSGAADEGVTFDSADSVGFTLTAVSSRREVQIRAGSRTRGPVRGGERQLTMVSAEVEMLGTQPAASLSLRLVPEFRLGFSETALRLILTIDSQRSKSVEFRVSGPSLPFADERITGELTVSPGINVGINGGINVERGGEPFSSFTFDASSLSTGLVIWVPETSPTGIFEVSVGNPQIGLDHPYVSLGPSLGLGLDFDASVSGASLSVEIVDAAQYVVVFEPSTPIAVEQGRSATFLVTTDPPLEAGESARVSLTLSPPTLGTSFGGRDRLEVSLSAALRSSEVEVSVPASAAIGSVISGEVSLNVVSPDPDAAGSPDQPAFSVSVSTPQVSVGLASHDGGALGDELVLSENAGTALRVSLAAGELTSPQQADLALMLEVQGSPGSLLSPPSATPGSFTLSPANLSTQLNLSAGDFGGLGGSFVLRVVAVNEVELRAPVELPVRVKRRVELGFTPDSLTLIHGGQSESVRLAVSPSLQAVKRSISLSA